MSRERLPLLPRILNLLKDGNADRRDICVTLNISAKALDQAIAQHLAAGTIVQEKTSGAFGRARSSYRIASGASSRLDRATRRCLMCNDQFESQGAGNRICPSCKATPEWRSSDAGFADRAHTVRYR